MLKNVHSGQIFKILLNTFKVLISDVLQELHIFCG